jgi:hypothetical protein
MTLTIANTAASENAMKARAISALAARGYRKIGVDGNGLPLFKSAAGGPLIGVGSCRSLAYSQTGSGGRLQLVATSRTAALAYRVASLDVAPVNFFPLLSVLFPHATDPSDQVLVRQPAVSLQH